MAQADQGMSLGSPGNDGARSYQPGVAIQAFSQLLKPPKLQDSTEAAPRAESAKTRISWRFHICGRLRGRKRNLQVCIARSRVLTSVRPLMRPIICRGPLWGFADRSQITATRSRRSVKNWLGDAVSHRLCAILYFRPPYA